MQRKTALKLASAVIATFAAGTAFGQSFQISIAVRETGTTEPVGGNGGTNNSIEFINLDGLTLNVDGTWQQFTFNFGTDPVTFFAGTQPTGGANNQLDGTRGVLEHIRIRNIGGITDDVNIWIDDVVNTVGGTPITLTGFEDPFVPGQEVMFQEPRFSGSTSGFLGNLPNLSSVDDTVANTGTQSYKASFAFNSTNPAAWVRLTTFNTPNLPNPAIDFTAGNTLSFWLRAETALAAVRWVADADGTWADPNNWNGGNIPGASAAEAANFLSDITGPRTITLDTPVTLNTMKFNSDFAYTINSNDPANNHITLSSTSTFTPGAVDVVKGSHTINAPILLDLRALTLNVARAEDVLTIGTEINFDKNNTGTTTNSLNKTGPGRVDMARVITPRAGINVAGGTLRLTQTPGGGVASNVATLAIAGTPAAPTAKLDLTNNGLVINYATTSPLADTVARITAGRATGDWSGNGITSSVAASSSGLAVGVAEASDLGVTSFMGQTVDATAVLVRLTRAGDANLDGTTGIADFSRLAANFNLPGGWSQGDFNYDAQVGIADFSLLAANFNLSVPADAGRPGAVPEPAALSLLAVGALVGLRRRRA